MRLNKVRKDRNGGESKCNLSQILVNWIRKYMIFRNL